MAVTTYEGVVHKGNILLDEGVQLPENVKVYVIVTNEMIPTMADRKQPIQILSPHFIRREDAADFKMTVSKKKPK